LQSIGGVQGNAAIAWDPGLALGVAAVDAQHQELFRRAAELVAAMERGPEPDEVESLLSYLARYVCEHFGAEEELMLHFGFAGLPAHRARHQEFIRAFGLLRAEVRRSGPTPELATRLGATVVGWLREHIGGTDLELARFLLDAQREAEASHPCAPPTPRAGASS
jgi:hemerythrin